MFTDNPFDFAAAMGFAEESMREETRGEEDDVYDELMEEAEQYATEATDEKFRLLYNENPKLAIHILKRFKEFKHKSAESVENRIIDAAMDNVLVSEQELQNLYNEMDKEIEDLECLETNK